MRFFSYVYNDTSKITQIRHSPKTSLERFFSILVKLHNICGYKTLIGFYFTVANKLRKFLKERGRRRIQHPVKRQDELYL